MRLFGLAAVLVGLVVASAPGQKDKDPDFPILIASPKNKDKVKVVLKEETVTKLTVGKEEKTGKKNKDFEYTDEVLAGDPAARLPIKVSRHYKQAMVGTDGVTEGHPIQGKTVVIEKRGGDYIYSLTDKKDQLDKDSKNLLDGEFNTPLNKVDFRDTIFPRTLLVKNNGTWILDGVALTNSLFGQDTLLLDKAKITATGKVENAKPEKRPHTAKVVVKINAPVTQFAVGEKTLVKAKEGTLLIEITGDGVIDGTSPEGTVTLKMTLKVSGSTQEGIDVIIDTTVTETRTTELLSKK